MRKEEKNQVIDNLVEDLGNNSHFYVTDISGLNVEVVNKLRRTCFKKQIELKVVKNTLLIKAMEKSQVDYSLLYDILKGPTSIMFSDTGNAPAKMIKEFLKKEKLEKPVIKGAFVEESVYVGEDLLATLSTIKSKEELIGDVIGLLQSPAQNVISALKSGGNNIAGVLKTLSEKSDS